jgi:hypothetical protein
MRRDDDPAEAVRDMVEGLRKVRETLTPEDWQMIRRTMDRVRKDVEPEDLRDQGKLMQKIQRAVTPEDMPRFMEIAGEILGSPEGRAMQKRMDRVAKRAEDFMESDRGQQLEKNLERMNGLFGNDKTHGPLEKLFPRKESEPH